MSAVGKTFDYQGETWLIVGLTHDAFICRLADGSPTAFRFTFKEIREALNAA